MVPEPAFRDVVVAAPVLREPVVVMEPEPALREPTVHTPVTPRVLPIVALLATVRPRPPPVIPTNGVLIVPVFWMMQRAEPLVSPTVMRP